MHDIEPARIALTDTCTIRDVTKIAERILDALNLEGEIFVDTSEVQQFDASASQVLIAAILQAQRAGKKISVDIESSKAVQDAFEGLGLLKDPETPPVFDQGRLVGFENIKGD